MKHKIITFTFIGYIILFSMLHIIIPDQKISKSERRELSSFPKVELSNEYITKVDKYLTEHFPFREKFRTIKATLNYHAFKRLENNNIYLKDNAIYKSNYPTNKNSVTNLLDKTNKLKQLLKSQNHVYFMLIPDKNYYLKDSNFLHIDYDYIYQEIEKINLETIDIREIMELSDYYETDTHWRQEKLDKVVKKMSRQINFNFLEVDYVSNDYHQFYGVYYGESAWNRPPEVLTYKTNKILQEAKVKYLENEQLNSIYNLEKLNSLDAYEVYLDGASSFIEITNPNSKNDRELVIFRDSFASSLTPLLVPYYKKITLIDNRYISSNHYSALIEFKNQDVIFMYSTLIANNSFSLKG